MEGLNILPNSHSQYMAQLGFEPSEFSALASALSPSIMPPTSWRRETWAIAIETVSGLKMGDTQRTVGAQRRGLQIQHGGVREGFLEEVYLDWDPEEMCWCKPGRVFGARGSRPGERRNGVGEGCRDEAQERVWGYIQSVFISLGLLRKGRRQVTASGLCFRRLMAAVMGPVEGGRSEAEGLNSYPGRKGPARTRVKERSGWTGGGLKAG